MRWYHVNILGINNCNGVAFKPSQSPLFRPKVFWCTFMVRKCIACPEMTLNLRRRLGVLLRLDSWQKADYSTRYADDGISQVSWEKQGRLRQSSDVLNTLRSDHMAVIWQGIFWNEFCEWNFSFSMTFLDFRDQVNYNILAPNSTERPVSDWSTSL